MKGIVFTVFLELVEDQFGIAMVEQIIAECDLKSNGVDTGADIYSYKEMVSMVNKLSELKNMPVKELLKIFGKCFFTTLSKDYSQFMKQPVMSMFFKTIDSYIHPEVLKLYPEAVTPSFKAKMKSDNKMVLKYDYTRRMADFAVGLIQGAAMFYKEKIIGQKQEEFDAGQTLILNIKRES
ncbi:MAG: hypothetical protein ACI85Q_001678 [Salibacteraceae bacterium]|jgi:hypothetical protein